MPIDLDKLERLEREATPGPWALEIPLIFASSEFNKTRPVRHGGKLA